MSRIIFFLSFAIALTSFARAQKTSFPDAVSFNDYLVNQQISIGTEMNNLSDSLNEEASDEIVWNQYNKLLSVAEKVFADLNNIIPYEHGSDLLLSFQNLIGFYIEMIKVDYKRMIEILLDPDFTAEDQTELQNILNKVEQNEIGFDNAFLNAQKEYAGYHRFELEPSEY